MESETQALVVTRAFHSDVLTSRALLTPGRLRLPGLANSWRPSIRPPVHLSCEKITNPQPTPAPTSSTDSKTPCQHPCPNHPESITPQRETAPVPQGLGKLLKLANLKPAHSAWCCLSHRDHNKAPVHSSPGSLCLQAPPCGPHIHTPQGGPPPLRNCDRLAFQLLSSPGLSTSSHLSNLNNNKGYT